MRIAVVADVHANLPALQAVLQEIDALGVDDILCLGDTVGYNAQPNECLDLVLERCRQVVAGNHDCDVVTGHRASGTHHIASIVQDWTRERLSSDRLNALLSLPHTISADGYSARHGAFLGGEPTIGYVTSTMLEENLRSIRSTMRASTVAFCGHTHIPLIGWLDGDDCVEPRIDATDVEWPKDASAVLINPGAVGQPRDRDPRAAFAIVDFERRIVRWHRVPYDLRDAADALARSGLPSELIDRLMEGR